MALIGMRYPVMAPVASETRGSAITYGTGMVMGRAISANITINRNNNPLYADDVEAENDNSITGGTIEIGIDDIDDDVRVQLLGETKVTGTSGAPDVYKLKSVAAPYVGVGYIRVRRKNGVTTFQAIWWHKSQFGQGNENGQTKKENIEWQTDTISGRLMGVYLDNSGNADFRDKANFTTEADAIAWLNAKANISTTS